MTNATLKTVSPDIQFASTEELVADIALGKMVVLVDDESRENEGDIVIAAETITAEAITFMIKQASGQICLAITQEIADRLELDLQPQRHVLPNQARFTVSIEAREGVTTGVSAPDRVQTILSALAPHASAADISTPGHVFPLVGHQEGLKGRAGHTEASLELCRLAGKMQAAVICEIIREDGEMARLPDLAEFCLQHNLKLGRIDQIQYYLEHK